MEQSELKALGDQFASRRARSMAEQEKRENSSFWTYTLFATAAGAIVTVALTLIF